MINQGPFTEAQLTSIKNYAQATMTKLRKKKREEDPGVGASEVKRNVHSRALGADPSNVSAPAFSEVK